MAGKQVIVTGANGGVGYEVALGALRRGADVVMVCRDAERGARARTELERAARGGSARLVLADLSSQREVRAVADRLDRWCDRIDVLVHNAGVVCRERATTEDGLERTLAVNHLAPFLLTRLLLPKLRASAPSRIVVVASQVEARGAIHEDDLQLTRSYDPLRAYFQSKLANVMFTYELARRLEGSGVTVNALHPGVLATNLLCDYMGRPRALAAVHRIGYPGPAAGAKHVLWLAFDEALAATSGRYFHEGRETESSATSRDVALQRRLWAASEALVGTSPGEAPG